MKTVETVESATISLSRESFDLNILKKGTTEIQNQSDLFLYQDQKGAREQHPSLFTSFYFITFLQIYQFPLLYIPSSSLTLFLVVVIGMTS